MHGNQKLVWLLFLKGFKAMCLFRINDLRNLNESNTVLSGVNKTAHSTYKYLKLKAKRLSKIKGKK